MQASQRASDNPALNEAIRRANARGVPLAVTFGLDAGYPGANARHFAFMLDGLRETEAALEAAGIPFILRLGPPDETVLRLAGELRVSEVVTEEAVLRRPRAWREAAARSLPVPLVQVPSQTVLSVESVPRLAATASVFRRWARPLLDGVVWAQPRPEVRHPWRAEGVNRVRLAETSTADLLRRIGADTSVGPTDRFVPGAAAALEALNRFVAERLPRYPEDRNVPARAGTSELSPYLHLGQIGPYTVARAVRAADAPGAAKEAFLEQLIIRRELAWNHCRYNPDYDRFEGLPAWGRTTLAQHAADPRPVLYSRDALEAGETHDEAWNAAQREMVETGHMHNYRRMVWAKRLLEWTATPEEAFETAVTLNDRYELDGRDPNGYAGIAWSIGGRHDRPWFRRPIYGVIRYMKGK